MREGHSGFLVGDARTSVRLVWFASAYLSACGFVGFEGHEPDASLTPDAAAPPMDAAMASDTSVPAIMEASVDSALPLVDANVDAWIDPDPQATQVTNYCESVPMLRRDPVIDGVIDSKLALLELVPLAWSNGSVDLPDHTRARYAMAWRPDGLYAYVEVNDPNRMPPLDSAYIWQGDGAEIYFDVDGVVAATYDDPGTMQIIVTAPGDGVTPSTRAERFRNGASQGAWASSRFAAFPTPNGYVLEAFLQADAVAMESLSLESGGRVGLDLSINVSVLDGHDFDAGVSVDGLRLGQYFLSVTSDTTQGCSGVPFCSAAAFCTPTLVD